MPRRPRRLNMAYKRARARRGAYRRRNRRYQISRKGLSRLRVKRPLGGFPIRKNVTLRYAEVVALNPAGGSDAVQVFGANNCFDPNYSGVGHQPMFFDNYKALYNKYKVNYATITMISINNHAINTATENAVAGTTTSTNFFGYSNERACRMFILADESPTDYPSDMDNLIEEGHKSFKWRYAPQTTSGHMQKLSMRVYPHRNLNVPFRDHVLASDVGGAPARPLYFICGVDAIADGADPDSMYYQFIITYNVTFFDFANNQGQN